MEMVDVVDKEFFNCAVELDGFNFVRCRFENVQLIYKGTGRTGVSYCTFLNPLFRYAAPASRGIEFLHALYHGFGQLGRETVEKIFENVKKYKDKGDVDMFGNP
jgi:hypothetical protein